MEQDVLKSVWQGITPEPTSYNELHAMIREKSHPVLKSIRKQLIIEIAAFTALLIFYYDFFDGDKKPWWANVMLVSAMSFVIIYNGVGYWLTKRSIKGNNIKESLLDQIKNMKTYAVASIAGRMLATIGLLIFFSSVIRFTPTKYWILLGIMLTLILQLSVSAKIWQKKISSLKRVVDSISEE